MAFRLAFHILILALLAAIGVWVVQQDLTPPSEGGFATLDGLAAAMYWFALLSYALISSVVYVILRKRAFQSLFIAYLVSAGVAIVATAWIVTLGQKYVEQTVQPQGLTLPPADMAMTGEEDAMGAGEKARPTTERAE